MIDEQIKHRQRKLLGIAGSLHAMLKASAIDGRPVLNTSRFKSILLHFEADRLRLEGYLRGDTGDIVADMREQLCPGGSHDWNGHNVCTVCAMERKAAS